ncbi:hypothetical protein GCM10028816_51810 [Spirosoma lituiforme]
MVQSDELRDLARERLQEAELMVANNLFQGAYYISGYAAEFAFKALICKRLNVQVFSTTGIEGASIVSKAVQIHNLPALMLFSGLYTDCKTRCNQDVEFFKAWNKVSQWSEQRRYDPLTCDRQTVITFVRSVKIIMEWTLTHY